MTLACAASSAGGANRRSSCSRLDRVSLLTVSPGSPTYEVALATIGRRRVPARARAVRLEDIDVEGGVAALVDGCAVAVFRTHDDEAFALANYDPFSKASVLGRGSSARAGGGPAVGSGPLKPVGLTDPRTGKRPYAVVQLSQDNSAGTLYNLVGFQTHLKWGERSG